ncbi:hypothetical protein [Streptomyces sp. NPDC057557]|uniref:hypothetical protein n=1 Tax=Streptomyces sp. NPDC057557 TaxID=3346167 RepID=UPI0036C0618C
MTELSVDLPGLWPLFGLYVVFLPPNPAVWAEGGFLHLEWDEREQRAELRIAPDAEPGGELGTGVTAPQMSQGAPPTPTAHSSDWPKPQKKRRRPEPLPGRPRDAVTPRSLDRRLRHLPPPHTHGDTNLTKHY